MNSKYNCGIRTLCDNKDCEECSNKAKYWDYSKNKGKPRDFLISSNIYFFFKCLCEHSIKINPNSIKRGRWCPFCCTPTKALCENNDCEHCLQKSFASSNKAQYWSEKNTDKPRQVFKASNKLFIFKCGECKHDFKKTLGQVSGSYTWCPYCGHKTLCKLKDCKYCFEKSFASSYKAQYWSGKNIDKPRQVFKKSNKKFLFECDFFHSFETSLGNIYFGSWCPHCCNKTERKLYEYLLKIFPECILSFKQDWCKNINHLPFDFYMPSLKIIIELDGAQHFKQISNWCSPLKNIKRDIQNGKST